MREGLLRTIRSLPVLLSITVPISGCPWKNIDRSFSAENAFSHVEKIVAIGPRIPGSAGSKKAQQYIVDSLTDLGIAVERRPFTADTPIGMIEMANIVASLGPSGSQTHLVIGTHYDTKMISGVRFVGANDGASGVGVLIELGGRLKGKTGNQKVDLVFFDGEESFIERSPDDWFYGSKNYVEYIKRRGEAKKVRGMILLDMVGDGDFQATLDLNSDRGLVEKIGAAAKRLGYEKHFFGSESAVRDDHTPFLEASIPALDIIDFQYGPGDSPGNFWHTAEDTMDKLSPQTLKIVGDVVLNLVLEMCREK